MELTIIMSRALLVKYDQDIIYIIYTGLAYSNIVIAFYIIVLKKCKIHTYFLKSS